MAEVKEVPVALGAACGARWWKRWKSKRQCIINGIVSTSSVRGSKNEELTSSCKGKVMTENHHVWVPRGTERKRLTTVILSEQNSTRFEAQRWFHKWAATTTENNSLYAIDSGSWAEDHSLTNHAQLKMAPWPSAHAASDETWNPGRPRSPLRWKQKTKSSQEWKSSLHQVRSERNQGWYW